MAKPTHYYIIQIQYLGFRYNGWAKHPNSKSVQLQLEKTINFILKDKPFKTLASGRTDAMVSAQELNVALYLFDKMDIEWFYLELNKNLPQDIKALSVFETNYQFNIIKDSGEKSYSYYYCFGDKPHPYSAPFISHFKEIPKIDLMIEGAQLMRGKHDFKFLCSHYSEDKISEREITFCQFGINKTITGSFIPEDSYKMIVKSKGFMYHQVRYMANLLYFYGLNKVNKEQLILVLQGELDLKIYPAPASGLHLENTEIESTK